MPAFQFETNLPVILLIIVIALISLYFYLDLKKVKLVNEELEKKNEMIIKEIDNIHLRLHKFFSGMPRGVVPMPKTGQTNPKSSINKQVSKEVSNDKEISVDKEISDTVEKMVDDTIKSTEISENEFNNLKKKPTNNIFGEIEDIIGNDNNIIQEKESIDIDENIVIPDLEPIVYNSDKITEVKDTDEEKNTDEEVDEVDDVSEEENSEEDNSEDEELSDDLDEDLLDKYMKMSVKDLKEKCIEMNLKHSGNKTTLARRIVENLE